MTRTEIFDVVKDNFRLVVGELPEGGLAETSSMADYGADSLQIVEVVSRSMKQLKLKVKRTELSEARNLGDLIDLFERANADKV